VRRGSTESRWPVFRLASSARETGILERQILRYEVGKIPLERVQRQNAFTWSSARQQSPPAGLRPFANWNRDCIH